MTERTNEQYLTALHNLFEKDYKNVVSRQDTCQYKGRKGERYCLATTHKTCRGCKFFLPTTMSQLRLAVEKTEELKAKLKNRDMQITKLRDENIRLNEIVENKDIRIDDLSFALAQAAEELAEYKEKKK